MWPSWAAESSCQAWSALAREPSGPESTAVPDLRDWNAAGVPQALTPELCGHGRDPGRSWLAHAGLINICGFSLDEGKFPGTPGGWAGEQAAHGSRDGMG